MGDINSSFNWQRQFYVTDHVKHRNGFTLYKITSVVYPKLNPEAGTKIVVWKRFNEFKVLHHELKRRHLSLHLGEEFPSLIRSPFFSRFSQNLITERKQFISEFLGFIARCPALFTTDVFVKFFQDGYNLCEYDSREFDSKDVSPDFEGIRSSNSALIFSGSRTMGQSLNSDGSKSDEESTDENIFLKSKFSKKESTSFRRMKKNYNNEERNFMTRKMNVSNSERFSSSPKLNYRDAPDYWEEAVAHANEAHHQEILGRYEVSFAMYKTAIVCLLSGVQADLDVERRAKVKELTSRYLQQAEWIYNNYLVFQTRPSTPKLAHIPWRSRSQLRRYKVFSVLDNNLLVQDVSDNSFVVIKGVLKSSCPLDRSEICVLPNDIPYVVKLLAVHETETTVFFVMEHVRYGKLWDHLEHYFNCSSIIENLDTELTYASPREKGEQIGSEENSVASSDSTNDRSLSRLESSTYTDTMSCESLSSHDENYFDLIEDYARAKSQKLKEIQDFNERRQHVESLRPVKKTVSQVDLKMMDDNFEPHRSHSLTDLVHEVYDHERTYQRSNESFGDQRYVLSDDEKEGDMSSVDMDTQQLLRNAQRLIESINETLSKSESSNEAVIEVTTSFYDENKIEKANKETVSSSQSKQYENENVADRNEYHERHSSRKDLFADTIRMSSSSCIIQDCRIKLEDLNFNDALTPASESIPSITEEYSITAILQRNGVTSEMIKKWAAQIVEALEMFHVSGVICRDLNPKNILLADNGSIKLTYFYRYPNIDLSLNADAKRKLYVAPEVDDMNCNVTFASDWWSFGAILYELITLQALHQCHLGGINSHTILNIPDRVHAEAKSLLEELLRYDPSERLGSGISGADDIKAHPYFADISWEDV